MMEKDLYEVKRILKKNSIWKDFCEEYNGTYEIMDTETYRVPVYRDDYIEPYGCETRSRVILRDIKTGEEFKISYDIFKWNFERV